ncbi:MAG: single-stranded DNA-binding protein [Shewanella xiamenensis]|uniref:Single-stranded DNA-binding protein n=3 Tax=Shewanella TaxID=22 RepID=A0AAE4TI75_9GAMM|nr:MULTISPECIES: single-stranded DNA-binding protein [Shewanella]MCD8552098.1 single-stranded DNA-binding protein [Shewanella xiamenensis]MCD8560386.1 single-stranded DNA-binding protein [Shewanella xiamenensis]MCT8858150.1 single-stranded DNA-binding protein [Shewanella xiamenensis]MDH0450962.1 single-stranded DNA-binding protein [Shewanella sp. GD04112]MDV5393281.1 single-stranded DNA-binding protein [Shewanella xiamenensis]
MTTSTKLHMNSRTAIVGGIVSSIQQHQINGKQAVWLEIPNKNPAQQPTYVTLLIGTEHQITTGQVLGVKGFFDSVEFSGQNNSTFTVTVIDVTEILVYGGNSWISINSATIAGNVGTVDVANGWINFSVATTKSKKLDNGQWDNQTVWLKCSIKEDKATPPQKGDVVCFDGALKAESYTDRNGNAVNSVSFFVNKFIVNKPKSSANAAQQPQSNAQSYQPAPQQQYAPASQQQYAPASQQAYQYRK